MNTLETAGRLLMVLLAILVGEATASAGDHPGESEKLARLDPVTRKVIRTMPVEWQVQSADALPASQVEAIGARLGHCWDFADCFVTMCRAIDIPARQMVGWIYASQGHVWAEVYIDGVGWKQVDPTGGGMIDCWPYHVGYVTSEDGTLPLVYLTLPELRFVER